MNFPQTRRENEVWQACDDLFAQGLTFHQMTGDNIIERLQELGYKKGNRNQIYQYRKTWAESRGIQDISYETAPITLNDPISRAVALVREEIQAEAEQTIAQMKEDTQIRINELTQKYEQLQKDYSLLEEKQEKLLQELNQTKTEHFSLTSELTQTCQQKAVIEEGARHTAQQLQLVREETQKRMDDQRQSYEQIVASLRDEIQAQEKYYQAELATLKDNLENQRHHYIAEKDTLQVALQKSEKQAEKITATEQAAQKLVEECKQQNKRYETELTTYKNDYKTLHQELLEKSKALAESQGELKQLRLIAEERKQQGDNYQTELWQTKQLIGEQAEALKQLKRRLEKQQSLSSNEKGYDKKS